MSHEYYIGRNAPFSLVPFEDIKQVLALQLEFHNHPVAGELSVALSQREAVYTDVEVADVADERLQEFAEAVAAREHAGLADEVLSTFPEEYLSEQLITPRQYIKSNGVDQNRRHLLAQARGKAVDATKDQLAKALDEDFEEYQEVEHGVIAEELFSAVRPAADRAHTAMVDIAASIKRAMPLREDDSRFNSILKAMGIKDRVVIIESANQLSLGIKSANLNRDFAELTEVVNSLAAGPEIIVDQIVEHYKADVERRVIETTRNRYVELATKAADELLPPRLNQAYGAAANTEYAYVSQAQREREASNLPEVSLVLNPEPEVVASTDFTIEMIDRLPAPFKWLSDTSIELSLVSGNGNHMLYTDAMPKRSKQISDKLRREPAVASYLDSLREKSLRSMVAQIDTTVSNVKLLTGSDGEIGHTIYYSGNVGRNAKRIYFARTYAGHYAAIGAMAETYGLPETTPLIIMVAETDKQNQLDVLKDFGISRAKASARGAGSV